MIISEQNNDINKFLELHFASDRDGALHLWAKKRTSNQMYRVSYGTKDAISLKIASDIRNKKRDYYLTSNLMASGTRRSDALFSLKNIVIDIDNHSQTDNQKIEKQFDALQDIFSMLEDEIYLPNTIVKTGRGFQLWYAIEQMSYKMLDVWQDLSEELIAQIGEILSSYPILDGLTVDNGASHNSSGLFRLPISYNSKSRSYADFVIIHDAPIDALSVVKEIRSERKTEKKPIRHTETDSARLKADLRANSILKLLKTRQDRGQTIERDNLLFCLCCIYSGTITDDAELLAIILGANKLFTTPLEVADIERYFKTALKKRYKIKNKTIIERLAITETEQAEIGLLSGTREEQRQTMRNAKALRNKKILELYQGGRTQQEIADSLGIARRTVCTILKGANARKSDRKQSDRQIISEAYKQALKRQINAYKQTINRLKKNGLVLEQKCAKVALYIAEIQRTFRAVTCDRLSIVDAIGLCEGGFDSVGERLHSLLKVVSEQIGEILAKNGLDQGDFLSG